MTYYPRPMDKLIGELTKLPGIGPKTGQRLAFHILGLGMGEAKQLARAVVEAKEKINYCSRCNDLTESDPCRICRSGERNHQLLCVVESSKDVIAMEKTGEYKGRYHVLHGSISPMDGIGPEDIKIDNLMPRINEEDVEEVILATDPNAEGDATAMYLAKLIKPLDIKVTRIAHGLPVGGDLEYADEVTLSKALEGRREL